MRALLFLLLIVAPLAHADRYEESRFCGEPEREADGTIKRRSDVLRAFRSYYPCPSTGEHVGACPGWQVDHVLPLCAGGCDAVRNLQWLPAAIKSGPGTLPKDRWERRVYQRDIPCRGSAR